MDGLMVGLRAGKSLALLGIADGCGNANLALRMCDSNSA